jgi:excisionase family DNA binding protein
MRIERDTSGAVVLGQIDLTSCATVSLAEAAMVLGVHRSTAWELYRRDEFPIPVLRVGRRLRISKVQLERYLLGASAGGSAS